jgi:DNA-directed RNA polymerase specialized sigma24 family protein
MTSDELEKLLSFLDPDRGIAAEKYEEFRRKLIWIFHRDAFPNAEDLADKVFDRVAHQLLEGLEVTAADPFSFVRGFTYFVSLEERRKRRREIGMDVDLPALPIDEQDGRLVYLIECLNRLSSRDRQMTLDYYSGDINSLHRRQVSEMHSLTLNALRIRLHRLRLQLEECIERRSKIGLVRKP